VNRRLRVLVVAALLTGSAVPALRAQGAAQDSTVDKIVAVVGKVAIVRSQVDEVIFGQQIPIPSDPADERKLRRAYLDSLIALELYVQAAESDTMVKVTPQEVADVVDGQIRKIRSGFQTELQFTQALKQSGFQQFDDFRRMMLEQQRRVLLKTRYQDNLRQEGKLKPRNPTDKELRD